MWLDGETDVGRAAREAELAIQMWEAEPPATRSLDDEALSHVYAATAHIRLGALDAASQAIAPVLALPPERRISWVVKRLRGVAERLGQHFTGSSEAASLRDAIREVSG